MNFLIPDAMHAAGPFGLGDHQVVACDASRYFSVAATADGNVWTFGACYNGALGSGSSWSTSAQPVAAELSRTIADGGGAVKVRMGCLFHFTYFPVQKSVAYLFAPLSA